MNSIIIYNLHIPILGILLIISYFVSVRPIQKDIIDFGRRKGNKLIAMGFIGLIYSLLYVNALYYLVEPYTIFAVNPGFITDHKVFDNSISLAHLIVFFTLPLISAATFAQVKRKLKKSD